MIIFPNCFFLFIFNKNGGSFANLHSCFNYSIRMLLYLFLFGIHFGLNSYFGSMSYSFTFMRIVKNKTIELEEKEIHTSIQANNSKFQIYFLYIKICISSITRFLCICLFLSLAIFLSFFIRFFSVS